MRTRAILPVVCLLAGGLVAGLVLTAGHSPAGSAPVTLGERVNGALDELMALCDRLLELPLFALVVAAGALAAVVAVLLARFGGRGRASVPRVAGIAVAAAGLVAIAVLGDGRFRQLQDEVTRLRGLLRTAEAKLAAVPATVEVPAAKPAPAVAEAATKPASVALLDAAAATAALQAHFPGAALKSLAHDPRIDVVHLHVDDPLIEAFVAVVDLAAPGVAIAIGGTLEHKTMTSDFASGYGCFVAVNGEAGESPAPGAPLGQWRGNLVVDGETRLREDPAIPRPFLWFDDAQHAHFVAIGEAQRDITPLMKNVMWGRLDSIVKGEVATADARNRQPRTAMGIDRDGRHLYLLVVDGRQPRYSMGVTRAEVGWLLAAFGAHDGMLCDEGGSSCMYLQSAHDVVNSPSDFRGQERETYTHFGVVVKP